MMSHASRLIARLLDPRSGWFAAALPGLLAATCGTTLAAGYQQLEIPASGDEPALQATVWTPCADAAAGSTRIGPYTVHATVGCPIHGSSLPLVAISHGDRGSQLGHHDTATALADAGFVVVSLNHPGNYYGDNSAGSQLRIFESRPRDISRAISFLLEDWPQRGHLAPGAVGVFGFSRGGYTALALAGATPSATAAAARLCPHWWSRITGLCRQLGAGKAPLKPRADARIRAAIAVDPLNLFDAAGLASVRTPVQLWASELGGDGVLPEHIEMIRAALPQAPEYHVARGAGHFAYLAPCSPDMAESEPRLCRDPQGFDRIAWHRQMNAAVVAFFKRTLHP